MRIGVIYLGRRGPGGPISFELANHLSKHADVFAVVSSNADHFSLWQQCGLDILPTRTFGNDYKAILSLVAQARLKALCTAIREHSPDVVLYPMVHPWTPFLLHYMKPLASVVTVHDPIAHPGLKHGLSSFWERMAARRASRCVVLSSRFISDLTKKGIPGENIDVIPHAMFSIYGQRPSNRDETATTSKSVLFFGRITAYKGLDVLLKAFEIVSPRHPAVHLQIVGMGNLKPYAPLLARLRNVDVINTWVPDNEVGMYFENAAFVVLPYTTASQSGVIPLAASFQVPVIATKVGALPDQIRNGETGLLVNPNSVTEIVSAMDTLLDQPDLARQMGQKLAEHMNATANWDLVALSFLESCTKAYCARKP